MLKSRVTSVGVLSVALSILTMAPVWADDSYETGVYARVSPVPAGALLSVGAGPSFPQPQANLPPQQSVAAVLRGSAAASSGPTADQAPVTGTTTPSTTSCVSALSGVPQFRPGGAYYDFHCQTVSPSGATVGEVQGTSWIPDAATGAGLQAARGVPAIAPLPPAAVLAREAADELLLPAPRLEMSPAADRDQVVGFPTWLWLDPASLSPRSRTVAVPGESVTAGAVPVSTTWVLGDGSTLTCTGAGTPYTSGVAPAAASPDCGHTYSQPSVGQPGGRFAVTVTTRWQISWAGAGQAGVLPELARSAVGSVRVAEVQTLNS